MSAVTYFICRDGKKTNLRKQMKDPRRLYLTLESLRSAALFVFLFSTRIIKWFSGRFSAASSLIFMQLFLTVCILGLVLLPSGGVILVLGLVFVLRDLKKPVLAAWANRELQSEHRAAMLSLLNMTVSLGEVAAGLLLGYLAGVYGLKIIFVISGILSTFVVVILLPARRGNHQT